MHTPCVHVTVAVTFDLVQSPPNKNCCRVPANGMALHPHGKADHHGLSPCDRTTVFLYPCLQRNLIKKTILGNIPNMDVVHHILLTHLHQLQLSLSTQGPGQPMERLGGSEEAPAASAPSGPHPEASGALVPQRAKGAAPCT